MASLDRQTYKSSWNPNVIEMTIKSDDDSAGSSGNAGVYSVDCTVPAGAYIVDVQAIGVLTWNSSTDAALVVGDGSDADGYIASTSCKTVLTTGKVTSILTMSTGGSVGAPGVYALDASQTGGGSYSSSARNVIASITTTGADTSAGETRIIVIYVNPTDTVSSSYVAT